MAIVQSEGRDGYVLRLDNGFRFAQSGIDYEGGLFAIWVQYNGPGGERRQYAAFCRCRKHAQACARALCEMHLPSARLSEWPGQRRPVLRLVRSRASA